jgi:WD40 repeat protein
MPLSRQTALFRKGFPMTRRKKRTLLALGGVGGVGLVVLTAVLGCPRGSGSRAGEDRPTVLEGHHLPVQAIAFSPAGDTLTSAAYHFASPVTEVEVTDWDVATGQPTAQRAVPLQALRGLHFAPGGRLLAAAGEDQSIGLWETVGSHPPRRLGEHGSLFGALAFSSDGSQLATAFEGVVILWEVVSGRLRTCWKRQAPGLISLAFAPTGTVLAGGQLDNTLHLWDVATGAELGTLPGHARAVAALAFSPDGRTVASGDRHGVVQLWDVATRTRQGILGAAGGDETFLNEVSALAFSPDGRTLAVAVGQAVRLWEVGTGNLVARLEGHEGKVKCLAFAPDGRLLASGSYDKTVRLWNVAGVLPQRPEK